MPRELPEDVRRLGRGKGDDRVGGEDRIVYGCGGFVGRPAGGQVNCENRGCENRGGENWGGSGFYPFQRRQRQPFQRRLEAGADDGVQNQVRFESLRVPRQVFGRLDDVDEAAAAFCAAFWLVFQALQFAPGLGRVAGEAIGRAQEQRGHLQAGQGEQPRRHQAVAAVVAAAAEDRHPLCCWKLLLREGGHRCRGRPHQIKRWNPEPLGRQAVAGLHLGCGKNVHGSYGTTGIRDQGAGIRE